MQLRIYIECDNAAFEGGDCGPEVARILRKLAGEVESENKRTLVSELHEKRLRDVNGNTTGEVIVEED